MVDLKKIQMFFLFRIDMVCMNMFCTMGYIYVHVFDWHQWSGGCKYRRSLLLINSDKFHWQQNSLGTCPFASRNGSGDCFIYDLYKLQPNQIALFCNITPQKGLRAAHECTDYYWRSRLRKRYAAKTATETIGYQAKEKHLEVVLNHYNYALHVCLYEPHPNVINRISIPMYKPYIEIIIWKCEWSGPKTTGRNSPSL